MVAADRGIGSNLLVIVCFLLSTFLVRDFLAVATESASGYIGLAVIYKFCLQVIFKAVFTTGA